MPLPVCRQFFFLALIHEHCLQASSGTRAYKEIKMPVTTTFQEALGRGNLVFDGTMGTEIYRHHVFTNRCFDELWPSDAKLIRTIHGEYRDARQDVLTTNTFGANRAALAQFGLAEKVREINRAGAWIAREAADWADRPIS